MTATGLGPTDDGRSVRVPPGATVEIVLPEPSGGGYLWSWTLPDGLRQLVSERVAAPSPTGGCAVPAPGAGGRRLLLLVDRPGRYVVRGELGRSWETRPEREYSVELVSE